MQKNLERIAIVGSSCSGKTTFARNLSKILKIEHRELDSFFWESGWTETSIDVFRERVGDFTSNDTWIVDGNYATAREIVWRRATHIVWLDFSLPLILKRFFYRSITRSFSKEKLWNGNVETLRNSIFSKDSLFLWILSKHRVYRKEYRESFKNKTYPQLELIHLSSPKEAENFLKEREKNIG